MSTPSPVNPGRASPHKALRCFVAGAVLLAAAILPVTAVAAIVDTLPFDGTPDWTDISFAGTSIVQSADGQSVTLTTGPRGAVWLGWGAQGRYGDYDTQPAWLPGSPGAGNHLSLTASLSPDAVDWAAWLFDSRFEASFAFAPSGCSFDCGGLPGAAGVSIAHAGSGGTGRATTFIDLDTTTSHVYEFLLKDGMVSYRIDGLVVYSGAAAPLHTAAPLVLVGDPTGHSLTGEGAMTLGALRIDTAPIPSALTSVPLPAPFYLLLGGLLALVPRRAARQRRTQQEQPAG